MRSKTGGCRTRPRSRAASPTLAGDGPVARTTSRASSCVSTAGCSRPMTRRSSRKSSSTCCSWRRRATGRRSSRRSSERCSSGRLNPKERHRLGAHYTPRAYVERLVRPTIEEPLRGDWDLVRAEVQQLVEAGQGGGGPEARPRVPSDALPDAGARSGMRHGQLPLRDARSFQAAGERGAGAPRASLATGSSVWRWRTTG